MSESFEELQRRMEAWLSKDGHQVLDLLRGLARDHCGLPDRDASAAALATLQRFVSGAGRTPDMGEDFRTLMGIFKRELITRLAGVDVQACRSLFEVVDQEKLFAALKEFPGGLSASKPEAPPEDWKNAVLAALSSRDDPEPANPWVHPDANEAPPPVPALVDRLFDGDPAVRCEAAEGLARRGPAAQPALPALTEALGDPDPDVREAARAAICALDG